MSFDPTNIVPPFPERGETEPGFSRLEALVTPDRLRRQYLFGIPLKSTLDNKAEMSDDDLKDYTIRAVSRLEHELKIPISPVKFTDRYDYNIFDYRQYNWIQLNHWPVLQIESFKAKYPHTSDFIQYPTEWITVYNEFGIFQLTPTNGSISQFLITNDASILPMVLGGRADWPQLWQVTYTCGYEQDKIPATINDLIATYAALDILEQLNSVVFLGSYGIGIDGVSQSVSLPGPGWLAPRIESMKGKAAQLLDIAKRYYNHNILVSSI